MSLSDYTPRRKASRAKGQKIRDLAKAERHEVLRLLKESRSQSEDLGHVLNDWLKKPYTERSRYTFCKYCGQVLIANLDPQGPDNLRVYGPAATDQCKEES